MAELSNDSDPRSAHAVQQKSVSRDYSGPTNVHVSQDMNTGRPLPLEPDYNSTESANYPMRVKQIETPGKSLSRYSDAHTASWVDSTGSQGPVTSRNAPENAIDSSETSSNVKEMNQWEAFIKKHERVVGLRIRACDLRRRCVQGRKEIRRLEGYTSRGLFGPIPSGSNLFDAVEALERDEQRLDELDQMIISAEQEMTRAAPKLLRRMRKSLPSMIEKHQLDFRGESSVSTEAASSALDDPLDPTAEEMDDKQKQMNKLENEVLALRGKRDRLAEILSDQEEENQEVYPEQWNEDLAELQDLKGQIDNKLSQLGVLKTEIDHMRDQAMNGDDDYDRLPPPTARPSASLARNLAFIYHPPAAVASTNPESTVPESDSSNTTIRAPTEVSMSEDPLSRTLPIFDEDEVDWDTGGTQPTRAKSSLHLVEFGHHDADAVPNPPKETPPQT
ncbi:uncharacterized protein AB675_4049 [Cyphellophora attinorum]|uniref:Uncharacterized protein n=1 Tax=Cyphellophora attinorum TaxID=1664694 RepID=A0A0N1H682_9EURO|nr:uncharacterized protein AB675_4049 [Phialophora attinorum]KPI37576.1 hypothetical protein AB675_4049 [Phialophora attinorum]